MEYNCPHFLAFLTSNWKNPTLTFPFAVFSKSSAENEHTPPRFDGSKVYHKKRLISGHEKKTFVSKSTKNATSV